MFRPKHGERVIARPLNPAIPVQRGDNLFGQMLSPDGQQVIWDDYLDRRFDEGCIIAEPVEQN